MAMSSITPKTRHLPVAELIDLMEEADEPWRFEDLILWRAGHLEDPAAIEWVCGQVKGSG